MKMGEVNIKFDDGELKKLTKLFKNMNYVVKVGILGGKYVETDDNKTPQTVALVGMVQEFGSIKNNIPERSFIRKPLKRHLQQEIEKSRTLKEAIFNTRESYKAKYNILGVIAQNIITDSFKNLGDGNWIPNAPATIKRKGSSQPLIDTGRLRKSITYEILKQ